MCFGIHQHSQKLMYDQTVGNSPKNSAEAFWKKNKPANFPCAQESCYLVARTGYFMKMLQLFSSEQKTHLLQTQDSLLYDKLTNTESTCRQKLGLTNTNGKAEQIMKCEISRVTTGWALGFMVHFSGLSLADGNIIKSFALQHWLIWSTNKTLCTYHPSSHACTHCKTSPFTTLRTESAISEVKKVFKCAYMHDCMSCV